jgi:ATP-dependent Clp protease ATP-binding subunit ClpX
MDHVKITFDPDVLDYIVSLAIDFKLGARGLRSICESIMIDVMYENPSDKLPNIRITKSLAEQKISKLTANRLKAG